MSVPVSKSEMDAEVLWSSIPKPLLLLGEDGAILKVNNRAKKVFQRYSRELVNKSLKDFISLEGQNSAGFFADLRSKKKACVDFTLQRESGTYNGSLKITRYPSEEVRFLALVNRFHKMKEQKEESQQRSSSHVCRQVQHDINNCLTVMGYTIDSMRADPVNAADKVVELARSVEYAKMITHSVSGMTAGEKVVLNKVRFSPTKLLDKSVKIFSSLASQKGITLSLQVRDLDRRFNYLGDCDKISRIINNLIGNAIKFTPENGEITIALKTQKPINRNLDKDVLVFSIADSGPGIPKESLTSIFKEGVQVGEKKEEGLGIGLSICKEFTNVMKGEIFAANDPETGGAVFTVKIPLNLAFASPLLPCSSDPVLMPDDHEKMTGLGIRVAIADDSRGIRLTMQRLLTSGGTGFEVETAENGEELLELLKEGQKQDKPYHVVITDLNMKKSGEDLLKDGDQATAKWRTLEKINGWSPTFFIGLTADETDEGRDLFMRAGVNQVVAKGASRNHFLQLIDEHVAQPMLKRQRPFLAEVFE